MIHIKLIGDILPADRQHTEGIGTGSIYSKNAGEDWLSVFQNYDSQNDILFGNLEGPFVSNSEFPKKKAFLGNPEFSKWISIAGFDLVSVANNHILEHGEAGFESTTNLLKKENVQPVGIKDPTTGSNLTVITKQDIKVGFAAFNSIHDILPNNSYAELNETNINKAIVGLKGREADIICLSFHWGNEYIHIPSWSQVQLAQMAIDAGANIIIGHHPHVIQPIEEYKNGLIIYSLGNFLFDMMWSKQVRSGMCVEIEIDENGIKLYEAKLVEIKNEYTPVIRDNDKWLNNLLNENYELMRQLLDKGKKNYESYYFKKLKRNRMKARLGMKKQLLLQWMSLPNGVKSQVIRGIFKKIKK
jgi:gamma-polyglutamate biosynthesis protein CapA